MIPAKLPHASPLLYYTDGSSSYHRAQTAFCGRPDRDVSGEDVAPEVGNTLPRPSYPSVLWIHFTELRPGQGACIGSLAGLSTFAQLIISREGDYAIIKLPSGET